MADLTSLHSQAKKLILLLRGGLERLETTEGLTAGNRVTGAGSNLARDLRTNLSELQRVSGEMDSIWRMQVIRENTSKRDAWKRKVEHVGEELDSIRHSLERYGSREQQRQAEAQDREELLTRAEAGRQAKRDMDEEAQIMGSVGRSKRYLEEMYETGSHILVNMAGNRERLKSAQKKVLDVLNSVGLGESLLKMIERRQRSDIYMAYGGMALILIVLIVVVWWAWF